MSEKQEHLAVMSCQVTNLTVLPWINWQHNCWKSNKLWIAITSPILWTLHYLADLTTRLVFSQLFTVGSRRHNVWWGKRFVLVLLKPDNMKGRSLKPWYLNLTDEFAGFTSACNYTAAPGKSINNSSKNWARFGTINLVVSPVPALSSVLTLHASNPLIQIQSVWLNMR